MHLKLRHLEVFHAVMEEGSITKAAEALNLSQPSISTALTKLEDMLGYKLFIRSKGHFMPKPEAYLLHSDAELSLMAVEQFASRARLIGQGRVGLIRVGAIGAVATGVLPELISAFSKENPLVEIELQVRSSSKITYLVGNGQLDIGLTEDPTAAPAVTTSSIAVPCVCIFHETSPLKKLTKVEPKDLIGQRLVGIQRGHQVDRQLVEVCAKDRVEPETPIHGFFFAVVRRIVANRGGVAIVDALNGLQSLQDGVLWRPFHPRIDYQISLISKSGVAPSKPARDFSERIREALKKSAHEVEQLEL